MREIKFRFWDGHEIFYVEELHKTWVAVGVQISDGECELQQRRLSDGSLMQFTGLRDKNGKELYEGDIVHAVDRGDWRNGEIVWGICGFFIRLKQAPQIWYLSKGHNGTDIHLEVIGNIYENPELLSHPTNS